MGKVLIFKDADFSQNAIDGDKDYVLADSITFDGSHYINLGRGLTQQSKVEICFTPTVLATGSQIISVCGVRTGTNLNQFDLRIIYKDSNNKFSINMVNTTVNPGYGIFSPLTINEMYTIAADIKNNNISVNGVDYANQRNVTGFDTGNINLYIGAYNDNGVINSGFTLFQGKLKWIKIYDNETLSNYFHAATIKVDGTPCLVDRQNDANKYYFVS